MLAWRNRPRLDPRREEKLVSGIEEADRFFNGEAGVQRATWKVAQILEENGIPYAITGGMALNAYGFLRVTNDVDLLLTREGLESFQAIHPTLTEHGVPIDVVLAGEYPGDGKPKPVAFPDPASVAVPGERVALLPLPHLIELKLASGMTAPHRLKDLADVLETVRALSLPSNLAEELDPYVREKYLELWGAAQAKDASNLGASDLRAFLRPDRLREMIPDDASPGDQSRSTEHGLAGDEPVERVPCPALLQGHFDDAGKGQIADLEP